MDDTDRHIINQLQEGFPICDAPYRQVASALDLTEAELLSRLEILLQSGVLSRFGPLFHAEQMGGALSLAALAVPDERFEAVAAIVNACPEVAHNYARNYALNMWFVLATETPAGVSDVIAKIEQQTGLPVYNMPKIREYYVGLKLQA